MIVALKPPPNYHPILFTDEMVRAILDGRKVQTRRIIKPQPSLKCLAKLCGIFMGSEFHWPTYDTEYPMEIFKCPYGEPGHVLWVREACQACEADCGADCIFYPADQACIGIGNSCEDMNQWVKLNNYGKRPKKGKTVPNIHMPFWACRLFLKVTNIRVERVQEISREDCIAEGIDLTFQGNPISDMKYAFQGLWESINAKRSPWARNDWVWVVEFERYEP